MTAWLWPQSELRRNATSSTGRGEWRATQSHAFLLSLFLILAIPFMYVYQNYAVSFIQEPENISHLTELGAIVLPGLRLASVKYLTCLICKHFTRQECRGYTWARTQTCLLWSSICFGPRQLALSCTAPARSWGDSIGQRPFPAKLICMHENEVMPDSIPFYLLYSTVLSGNVVYPITV